MPPATCCLDHSAGVGAAAPAIWAMPKGKALDLVGVVHGCDVIYEHCDAHACSLYGLYVQRSRPSLSQTVICLMNCFRN